MVYIRQFYVINRSYGIYKKCFVTSSITFQGLVYTLKALQMNFVLLIHSSDEHGESSATEFTQLARRHGICIPYTGLPTKASIDVIYKLMNNVSNNSIAVAYLGNIDGALQMVTVEQSQNTRPNSLTISWIFTSAYAEHYKFGESLRKADRIICFGCNSVTNDLLTSYYMGLQNGSVDSPIASLVANDQSEINSKPLIDSVVSLAQGVKDVLNTTCKGKTVAQCSGFHSSLVDAVNKTNVNVSRMFPNSDFYPYTDKVITLTNGVEEFEQIEIIGLENQEVRRPVYSNS